MKAQMCCRCGPGSDSVGSNFDQGVKVCVFDSGLCRAGRFLATGHSVVQGFSPTFRTRKTEGPELHWHVGRRAGGVAAPSTTVQMAVK